MKMTKTKNKSLMRTLGFIMAVCMVISCWVVTPLAIKAEAATAGTYYVRIKYTIENPADGSAAYTGQTSKTNKCCGFTIYYKKNNGTDGTEEKEHQTLSAETKNTSGAYKYFTLSGFPTKVRYYNCGQVGNTSDWRLKAIEVYNYETKEWDALWSGSFGITSTASGHYNENIYVSPSGFATDGNGVLDKWETSTTSVSGAWKYPKISSVTIDGADSIATNCSSNVTQSYTATVKDQYGVVIGTSPKWSVTSTYWSGCSVTSTTVANDSTTLTIPPKPDETGNKTITLNASATFNSVTKIGSKTITISPKAHDFTEKNPTSTYLKSEATCTSAAVYFYKCKNCTAYGTETFESGNAADHKSVPDSAVSATPDTVGLTAGSHCSVCNAAITAQEVVAMTGHSSVYESGLNTVISGKYQFVGVSASQPSSADMVKTAAQTTVKTALGSYGTVTVGADGKAKYKVTTMRVEGTDTFWLVAQVKVNTNNGEVTRYVYEKIIIVPSKTLYYEDSFTENGITYVNGVCPDGSASFGVWGYAAGGSAENSVDGIDFNTDYSSSATYSMGNAHKVTVSELNKGNENKNWPRLTFTFAGTGFDLISHTSTSSGMFAVTVYRGTEAVKANKVKSDIIDTYRGYTYGKLYYDRANQLIATSGEALYEVTDETAIENGEFDIRSNGKYYSTKGSGAQAEGWLQSKSSGAMYQVPVMSVDNLTYGVYTVTVEARFTQAFGHFDTDEDGNKFYELTVDALRIHNPAGEVDEVKALHDKIEITEIRDIALGADTKYDLDVSAGCYILDGNKIITNQELRETFFRVSPNNELYLASGQSITFELNTEGYSDILLGMRAPTGAPSRVTLTYNNTSADIDVTSATELYRSLEKDLGASGLVTVTNNGEGILSLTNVMTIKEEGDSAAKAPLLVSSRTIPNAVAMLNVLKSDLSIDEDSIEKIAGEDGRITLSVTTGKDISSLIVRDENGNEITPDEINSVTDGEKLVWTVTLTESESGKYTYTLQGVHESGFTNGELLTVSLEIEIRSEEPGEEPSGEPEEEPSDENTTEQKLTLWEKLLEIVKHILTIIFGIEF